MEEKGLKFSLMESRKRLDDYINQESYAESLGVEQHRFIVNNILREIETLLYFEDGKNMNLHDALVTLQMTYENTLERISTNKSFTH